ncbi:MAG: arylamine N-acetyltransferase [Phaeodactylibacter sp.]|nr:arylamine N-acetyltransferase [Phaeodactylibacter sp.]
MKKSALFLLLFCYFNAQGQSEYALADSLAASFSKTYTDPAALARELTTSLVAEKDKARAIFTWIALNIRYDCAKFRKPSKRPEISASSKEELEKKVAAWQQEELHRTLKLKKGICQDYAYLFKALCDAVGLEAVFIGGVARDFHRPYRTKQDNSHAWNAVKIDGQWYLLDATWGAGHVNAEVTRFTQKLSTGYFMTPPQWFAQNHFPDDTRWQLLDNPLDSKAFADQPLINYGQGGYIVEGFSSAPEPAPGAERMLQVRLKFANTPAAIVLLNSKPEPIKFTKKMEEGWLVLQYPGKYREVTVLGGESTQKGMGWLARYRVQLAD